MSSSSVVPDADVSETQVRTSSDSGLPDEKCSSLKSSSVSSSSSNLSTGSPTQTMTHIDPRVALTHILETVGDAALLDDIEKVASGDVRRVQKEGSLRRHSDENVSPRLQTLRTLSKETKSEETICVKDDESHTAASQAAKDRSKLHQAKPLDELMISMSHVQSAEGNFNRGSRKTELNTGANTVARRDVNIKSSSCAPTVINATKSTDCDNVKPSATVSPHKTYTAAKAAVTRTASVERNKQSYSNVPVKTQGPVAGRPQPLLVKTKQVLAKASQPERNHPRLRQTRPQPSGTKPQVAAKTNVQRINSSQQATRVKAQQRLSDAIRATAKKDTPMVPPRVKRRSLTSMSPAIQQLQRTPQKKFTSPTREPQLMRTNKPEQFLGGKILEESVESAEVKKDHGTVWKSSSMKEVVSPKVEQKQLSSSAGSVLLTTKLLLDTSRQDPSGEKHLRVIHHGEHHPLLDTAVETPSLVKPTVHTRPATAIDAPKVTQYTKIFVDNAPDTQKQPPNVSVEHTGPVIQDAFESLNRRKAEEARTLLEKQRQQLLKPKSAMKSRPGSSVKKQGAKSAVCESRPTSVKKSAKAKPTDDTLSKGKKGKAGKKGKSKKKGAAAKEKTDECGDNLTGDEWCDNVDDRRVTVVQSRLSLLSDGDSDDEYLFSKTSYPGGDLSAGVRSWHRTDVDQTLPGQTQLADPDDDLSLLPEHDSIVNSVDLYDDVETILDEVAFGVDDDDDTLLTDRTNQTSESLRLQALIQSQNDEETESENPLRQTDQAIRDFAGTVTNTELDKMLETARIEKEDTLPERTTTQTGVTKSDDKDASSKPEAEAEKPEEEDVNKIIEEILKSTPDPTKSISLKFKERKRRRGSGRRSKTMEDIAKELQRSQERTFRELPTQLSHVSSDASSDHTLTESNQKHSHSDPEKSSSSGELEEEQMKKLMDTVKRLQLRVDTNAEVQSSHTKRDDSATKRPPPGPKGVRPVSAVKQPPDGAQYGGGRKPEKSPRFVRRHESFLEVKDGAGSRRQSVSKVR